MRYCLCLGLCWSYPPPWSRAQLAKLDHQMCRRTQIRPRWGVWFWVVSVKAPLTKIVGVFVLTTPTKEAVVVRNECEFGSLRTRAATSVAPRQGCSLSF